jgi:hypothetical protein
MTHLIKSIQLIIPADALKMPKLIGGGGDALVLGSSRQNIHNSMARLAHSAHDQACHSLHSAGKSSGSKVFFSRCFSKAPSKVRCSSRNGRLRRSGRFTKRDARKIAVSQNVLAVLAVLFFHTCSTSGDQECVEI